MRRENGVNIGIFGPQMQLNHLDLCVPDLDAAVGFFSAGFGFSRLGPGGNDLAILTGAGGFVLVLTTEAAPQYPASFHIGFLQSSREAVMQVYQGLLAAGIAVPVPPAEIRNGLLFYCQVPGGIPVEVAYRQG